MARSRSGCTGSGNAAPGETTLLSFAAAPTFALMALWIGLSDDHSEALCISGPDVSPLGSMATMYALMGVFHAVPWLNLISGWVRRTLRFWRATVDTGSRDTS